MQDYKMKFGDYIRRAREARGWTQPEAARKIGIEQSYLSKLENSHNYPAGEVFDKISEAYSLDHTEMGRLFAQDELKKLEESSIMKSLLAEREAKRLPSLRGWLLTGLLMTMVAAALATIELAKGPTAQAEFHYLSKGLLKEGEPVNLFDTYRATKEHLELRAERKSIRLAGDCPSLDEAYQARYADYQARTLEIESRQIPARLVFSEPQETPFYRTVEGGKRFYELKDTKVLSVDVRNNLLLALATALFLGGLISFYISRIWR